MTNQEKVRAVIFDFDGTITKPYLDFRRIKAEIGLPADEIYLLERIEEMPQDQRTRAMSILERYETEAVTYSVLNDGVREVLDFLQRRGIKTALLSRNSTHSLEESCRKHGLSFELLVTRDIAPVKPKPDGIIYASRKLGIPLNQIIMVGDYQFDIMAGKNAGVHTVLLTNRFASLTTSGNIPQWDIKSDFIIHRLVELIDPNGSLWDLIGNEN